MHTTHTWEHVCATRCPTQQEPRGGPGQEELVAAPAVALEPSRGCLWLGPWDCAGLKKPLRPEPHPVPAGHWEFLLAKPVPVGVTLEIVIGRLNSDD